MRVYSISAWTNVVRQNSTKTFRAINYLAKAEEKRLFSGKQGKEGREGVSGDIEADWKEKRSGRPALQWLVNVAHARKFAMGKDVCACASL